MARRSRRHADALALEVAQLRDSGGRIRRQPDVCRIDPLHEQDLDRQAVGEACHRRKFSHPGEIDLAGGNGRQHGGTRRKLRNLDVETVGLEQAGAQRIGKDHVNLAGLESDLDRLQILRKQRT